MTTDVRVAITALRMIRESYPQGPNQCDHPAEALEYDAPACSWMCGECWGAVADEHVVDRIVTEEAMAR